MLLQSREEKERGRSRTRPPMYEPSENRTRRPRTSDLKPRTADRITDSIRLQLHRRRLSRAASHRRRRSGSPHFPLPLALPLPFPFSLLVSS